VTIDPVPAWRAAMLLLVASSTLVIAAAIAPAACEAQVAARRPEDTARFERLMLSPEEGQELLEIEAQSRLATALYVSGIAVHVSGLVIGGLGGLIHAASTISICVAAPCGRSDTHWIGPVLGIGGGVAAAAGLAILFGGVGVDVASSVRRRAWERDTRRRSAWSIAPSRRGLMLGREWTF
jgi:hypothetical protein